MATDDAQMQMKAHVGTYTKFLGLLKKGGFAVFIIAVIVVLIISR